MKFNLTLLSILLFSITCSAQSLVVNGNIGVGIDGDSTLGKGKVLLFQGVTRNSDNMSMYRFNRTQRMSDIRVELGDDAGQPDDRFVVGASHFSDKVYRPFMVVQANGQVGIGTENFGDEKLAVKGKIHATSVVVNTGTENWPDFVFEKSFNLPSLPELEVFINQHKHLPEIPSAAEVNKNGIDLGDMNAKLLKKIEELTLYLIEMKKDNLNYQTNMETLQEQVDQLNKKLAPLIEKDRKVN